MKRLALVLLAGGAACTVSLGRAPDAGPCAPSPAFFVSDVWPGYLDENKCASTGCHDFTDGHGYLRYRPVPSSPSGGSIDAWPSEWRLNYLTSIQLVRCDDPLQSRLLSVPEGNADPHPVGAAIEVPAVAEQILRDWVAQ
jgi:hypothetical protein